MHRGRFGSLLLPPRPGVLWLLIGPRVSHGRGLLPRSLSGYVRSKAGEAKRYVHQHSSERGKLVKVRSKAPSVRKQQVKDSGGQKVSKRKMNNNSIAKDFVFVYSLGDEMNKLHKFREVR